MPSKELPNAMRQQLWPDFHNKALRSCISDEIELEENDLMDDTEDAEGNIQMWNTS